MTVSPQAQLLCPSYVLMLFVEKRYTFILKDELFSPREDGREQASISYEADFELPPQTIPGEAQGGFVFIPWASLNATYRGKVGRRRRKLRIVA